MKFSHIVASRDGLFLVNRDASQRAAEGSFFGVTIKDRFVYCFDSVKPSTTDETCGCIVRYPVSNDGLGPRETMITGLHAGCHQIDFVGDHLFVVDTYKQQILEIDPAWNTITPHWPLPQTKDRDHVDYVHFNSIFHRDGQFNILLHNMGRKPSEILVTDADFKVLERHQIEAESAHDLVPLEDGKLVICDSTKGRLLLPGGKKLSVDALFTRGLSIGRNEIVVGSSLFGQRAHRDLLPGFVTFFDRQHRRTGRLHIESSPTQIRRLDGQDYSLSNFRRGSAPEEVQS